MKDTAKATIAVAANMMMYCSGWLRHSRMPKMPVTPVPVAPSWVMEQMRAPTAAPAAADEGLDEAEVHAEDGGLGDAHEGGEGGGGCEALDLSALGLEGDGEAGTALADVGGASDGQPVGDAVLGELAQVDGGVHLVQAGYDGGGVQATDDGGPDAQGQGEQELDAAQDGVLKIDKDGADGGDGDKRGDEDGYQRRRRKRSETYVRVPCLCSHFSRTERMKQAITMGMTWPW